MYRIANGISAVIKTSHATMSWQDYKKNTLWILFDS